MSDHDDFAFDVAPGIPAPLPKGEEVLWQGRPDTNALAREAFKIRWIAGYMALIVLWKAGMGLADGGLALAVLRGLPYLVLAVAAVAVVWLLAWAQARATVYTVTSARVLMKIGAALSVTYNIPFAQVGTARLDLKPTGTGTIALETLGETRLAFMALWPHLRPGRMKRTEPALRCIPDAERVARLLAEAAEARLAMPVVTRADAALADAVAAE
ncbi:PH domain-containing protein [Rhodobacter sp. HX-7-19]|uniref:PH domain-containing protein n=1 Tax=Paragemmobacter kunshanensis TaxID=2583234 RepID=A0A6M1TTM3_9RHOB|nr:photosynthetic complex putative assembly protein PuhB [Rhodobacter kunshanensis]NGQ91668.1 PH domain-containing protein [Rhodobacter kunshanensis]